MSHKFPMANKSFGQHFLNSPSVIQKITSPLPKDVEAIIEIGPGPAVLTPHLAQYQKPLFVIEMDERFVEILAKVVHPDHIYRTDALEFNWNNFLSKHNFKSIWLVSNLPYNVSVPLTLSFLRIKQITHMTLMYQKEVADKIFPKDTKNSMGSLHALCLSQFHINFNTHAPPGAFVPPPKVDSSVLNFARKSESDVSLSQIDQYESFLRVVFSNRRKQLGGILKKDWGADKALSILNQSSIAPEMRAEALNYKQVLKLYENFINYSS